MFFYFSDQKITLIYQLFLFVILSVCLLTDVVHRKIYNVVTYPLMLFSLISVVAFEKSSIGSSLTNFGIATVVLIPFFFLRILGAGDVKLMLAFALLMPRKIFWEWVGWAFIFTAAAGVFLLFYHRRTKIFFEKIFFALKCLVTPGLQAHIPKLSFDIQWPFGVALWMAYLKIVFWN